MLLGPSGSKQLRELVSIGAAPFGAGLATVTVLTHPWDQGAWRQGIPHQPHLSIASFTFIGYALAGAAGLLLLLLAWRNRALALAVFLSIISCCAVVSILDATYPFSQVRYYTFLSTFVVGACVVALPAEAPRRSALCGVLGSMFLLGEIDLDRAPFHGVRVAVHDVGREPRLEPLHRALEIIASAPLTEPVAIDYVPQFANWYLPGRPIALVPEPGDRTRLNSGLAIWGAKRVLPIWDVHYLGPDGPGTWHCRASKRCTFTRIPLDDGRYVIELTDGTRSTPMCVIASWPADPMNNSIFTVMDASAFSLAGAPSRTLVVGRQCR
jgi:hypothetical protein